MSVYSLVRIFKVFRRSFSNNSVLKYVNNRLFNVRRCDLMQRFVISMFVDILHSIFLMMSLIFKDVKMFNVSRCDCIYYMYLKS